MPALSEGPGDDQASIPRSGHGHATPAIGPEGPGSDLGHLEALRILGLILFAGLFLRLVLWSCLGGLPIRIGDELEYNAIAVNVAERGEFATRPGDLTSIRPPLYPALVAGVYEVAGSENIRAVRLLQIGMSVLTIWLVYALGSLLNSRRVGIWAAGIYSVYPSMVAYSNLLLTEVLFTALLCATCVALVWARHRDSIARLVPAGILLGLSALARSVLWPFPILLGGYLLLTWKGGAGRRLLAGLTVAIATYATIAPWAIRNTQLQRTFTTIDVMSGRNLMMGNYEYTPLYRAWDAVSIGGERAWFRVLADRTPGYSRLTQGQIDKVALRAAVDFVREHPGLTLQRDIVKFFNFWGLERELVAGASRGYFGEVSTSVLLLLTAVIFGSYVATMVAGIFGAAVRPPADWRGHLLLLMIIGYICVMHTLSFGHSRYHIPLIPLVLVYAATAVVHRGEIWSRRGTWPFMLAFALVAVLAAGWSWEVLIVDQGRFADAIRSAA